MNRFGLILRNLKFFRLANLAVIAGMAVTTAVLTGALMVGDSVRSSLRDLALQRLGPIDHALVSTRFLNQDLAGRIASSPQFKEHFSACIPAISIRGGAANESGSARTAGVQINAAFDMTVASGQAVLNGALADLLDLSNSVSTHPTVLLTLPTATDLPRDATFARRGRSDVTGAMRVKASEIVRSGMPALFSLAGGQRTPLNVWTNLGDVQEAINQPGQVNLLLVHARDGHTGPQDAAQLNQILRQSATLDDYGLQLAPSPDGREAVLTSRSTYILPVIEEAAAHAAAATNISLQRVCTYLANRVDLSADSTASTKPASLHYCIIAGIDNLGGPALADDEIAINQWTADQLHATVGDRLRFTCYQRQPNGDLKEVLTETAFRIARILPMSGLGADRSLTPVYKGFTDANAIADWNPPEGVNIDKKLVTPADEQYWNQYRGAPKLFVNLAVAKKLWGSPFGDLTSLRLPASASATFAARLRDNIDPAALGLIFQPLKDQQLRSASGGTDFAGLFIGFSFFIIVAAAMLLAMLFRLSIEQRARQFGLLSSLGFSPRSLHRLALAEGLVLALIGGIVGIFLAIGYTALMMAGLRTWWITAVGTTSLHLYVSPATLAGGFVGGVLIAALAILWSVRRIARTDPATLLAGGWGQSGVVERKRGNRTLLPIVSAASLVFAVALLALGAVEASAAEGAFLGAGALLLVSALTFTSARLRTVHRQPPKSSWSLAILGLRNARRHGTRSLLTIALIAFASFVLVTVSAFRQSPPADTHDKATGTGGYQLILQADVPLMGDLNTPAGRDLLALRDPRNPLLAHAKFMSLRTWAGQDISCLNLTKPTAPTILAVPHAMVEEGAFAFAGTEKPAANPWTLLEDSTSDEIPVIADSDTAQYILQLSIGDTLPLTDQLGQPRKLKLVATLAHSIFQSQLLMGEANFLRLFPSQAGFGMVLVQCPHDQIGPLQRLLATELDDFSVTVDRTTARLAQYQDVANTYLSTFQTLGALGLMLGTIGLAVILLRNLIERRAELALLSAIGFRPFARVQLVLAENVLLLVLGLAIGAACSLIGILPTLISSQRSVNLSQLSLTLATVLLLGLLVLSVATALASRRIGPADLRAE